MLLKIRNNSMDINIFFYIMRKVTLYTLNMFNNYHLKFILC